MCRLPSRAPKLLRWQRRWWHFLRDHMHLLSQCKRFALDRDLFTSPLTGATVSGGAPSDFRFRQTVILRPTALTIDGRTPTSPFIHLPRGERAGQHTRRNTTGYYGLQFAQPQYNQSMGILGVEGKMANQLALGAGLWRACLRGDDTLGGS